MALKELITWVGDEKDDEGLDFDLECKMVRFERIISIIIVFIKLSLIR